MTSSNSEARKRHEERIHKRTYQDLCTCGLPWPCFMGVVGSSVFESSDIDAVSENADTVTITISRRLAIYCTDWTPGSADDPLVELRDACRAALEADR
jgi:hypothetical protein